MKRLLLVFVLLASVSAVVSAQSIKVNEKDGDSIELSLDGLRKLSFSDGNLVATFKDGTSESYEMSDISGLSFDSETGVGTVSVMEGRMVYSASQGLAVVAGSEGSTFSVFNLSGNSVLQQKIGSDLETVDLSSLQKGVYLVRLGSKTVKIVR